MQAIQTRFADLDHLHDLGDLSLKINGCMNACAHHHLGNIGILGVEKAGEEWYQIMLGGEEGKQAGRGLSLGKVIGPALRAEQVTDAVERIVSVYTAQRLSTEEAFSATYARIGPAPFKQAVYPARQES